MILEVVYWVIPVDSDPGEVLMSRGHLESKQTLLDTFVIASPTDTSVLENPALEVWETHS